MTAPSDTDHGSGKCPSCCGGSPDSIAIAEKSAIAGDTAITVSTLHLRRGVKFHGDWGELTADDVVYSLTRSADPKRSSFAALS